MNWALSMILMVIGKIAREKGIFFHVDAAQSTGKVAIDLKLSSS